MSDLQWALAGIGAVFVALVFGYNKWQEKKLRERVAQSLPQTEHDALLDTPAVERKRAHTLAPEPVAAQPPTDVPPAAIAPEVSAFHPIPEPVTPAPIDHTLGLPPLEPPVHAPRPALLDQRVDFIAMLTPPAPVSGEEVLRRAGEVVTAAKPIAWEGRTDHGRWEELAATGTYSEVRCGLQMLDRRGLIAETDVVAFSQSLQSLAATLGAEVSFPSRRDALRLAAALDEATVASDIQVVLNIVHATGIAAAKVRVAAESEGCILGADGAFRLFAANGAEVFTVANAQGAPFSEATLGTSSTRKVAVTLDVPRAPETGEAFNQFVRFAERLAHAVGGQLVDDKNQPVIPSAMLTIAQAVAQARAELQEAEIPPGSALARRLFA